MKLCGIFVPTRYNDGRAVPTRVITAIRREIDEEFDGHTTLGPTGEGTFKMPDGSVARDVCIIVLVAVEEEKLGELEAFAAGLAPRLKQEKIFFVVLGEAKLLPGGGT